MAEIGNAAASAVAAVRKWRCDVCQVRFFEDFDEACAHEAVCQPIQQQEKDIAKATSATATLVTQNTLEMTTNATNTKARSNSIPQSLNSTPSTATTSSNPKQSTANLPKPPSPIITPTKTPAKSKASNRSLSQTRIGAKKQLQPTLKLAQNNNNNNNSSSNSAAVIPLVQAIKEAMSKQLQPMKESKLSDQDVESLMDLLHKLDSLPIDLPTLQTTLIGKTVAKFKKHPPLATTCKTLVDKWKVVAGQNQNKAKATVAKQPSKSKPQPQPQHAFFNPRTTTTSSKPNPKSANRPVNSFFAPRKKKPSDVVLEESKSLKRKLPPKLSPETNKAVAAIFQNKSHSQIIAEQRKAELAANRAAERQRERERATKRAALFAAKSKKPTASAPVHTKPLLPLATRFPVPNHVTANDASTIPVDLDPILPPIHPLRSTTATSNNNNNAQPATLVSSWISSPSALDTVDVNATTFTAIQRALFDTFSILPKLDNPSTTNNTQQLWKHLKTLDSQSILGDQPRQVFGQLAEFIDHWRVARNESLERAAERHRKLAKGKKKRKPKKQRKIQYYDDDDWLVGDDVEDDDIMAPLCLLVGPHASGKTAMVHSVAKHCGDCKVLEINTSRARNGASLKHAIEEATQSNSSLEMLQTKTNTSEANNFFAKPSANKRRLVDSDSEDDDELQDKKKSSVTIILIDEVDILFEEADAGFWPALWALAKDTKCPIVLTANDCPPQLNKLPCKVFSLERPLAEDCAAKLWGICRNPNSGLKIRPEVVSKGPEAIQTQLAAIATTCDCDLRKLYHELQVFAALAMNGVAPPTMSSSSCQTSRNSTSKTQSLLRLDAPTITALEPSRIPMNQHSVVVASGSNFRMLLDTKTQLRLGSRAVTNWHVVNDSTLLLQCPPYLAHKEDAEWATNPTGRWLKRIAPVSIVCCSTPALTSAAHNLVLDALADGTQLRGTYCPIIEYTIPEQETTIARDDDEDDEDEAEFESETTKSTEPIESAETMVLETISTDPDGKIAWKAAIEKHNTNEPMAAVESPKTTPRDVAAASELDFLAQRYRDASDAALLEDFGDGLPYLSGACRGFGYDYTEDGCASYPQGGADTLKMHEKSKPPREEKLFALGWKDNCCFYGNSETYMTLPSMSQRREAKTVMNHFRGDEITCGQLACASSASTGTGSSGTAGAVVSEELQIDSPVFREDLDAFVHNKTATDDSAPAIEDSYLPRGVSQLVLDLPQMLRTRSKADSIRKSKDVWESLESHRNENLNTILHNTTNYILPPFSSSSHLSKWSYGRFSCDKNLDDRNRLILECLPALRHMATVERCAEFVHEQQLADAARNETSEGSLLRRSSRRVTRAAPKQRFHHYFDKLSTTLRRDEADIDTSQVGVLFAEQWRSDLVNPYGNRSSGEE